MPSDIGFDEYDRFARRIERWDGVEIRQRMATGRSGHIIDWQFSWPGEVYATPDPRRFEDVQSSAVIFDTDERVSSWQLRLAQIPVESNPREGTKERLEARLLDGRFTGESVMVLMADGEEAWTPHVQPTGHTPAQRDPDRVLDIIHNIWTNYQEMAAPDGDI